MLVAETYLWTGEGPSDRNLALLHHIVVVQRAFGSPMMLFGDFQMTQHELLDTGWPRLAQLDILTNQDIETCFSGQTSRAIDHCIVSKSLAVTCRIPEIVPGPRARSTHWGVKLVVNRRPRRLWGRQYKAVSTFPLTEEHKKHPGECTVDQFEAWLKQAELEMGTQVPRLTGSATEFNQCSSDKYLQVISRASELYLADLTGIKRDRKQYFGRGTPPKEVVSPSSEEERLAR